MTRFNMCVCAMALLSSACVGTSGSGAASNAPVNFGMPMGYTGRLSVVGDSWLKGGQAGADVVNSSGGVNGQKVKIVPVDTALDPVDAVTATRKMLAVDNVKVSIGLIALDYPNALPILNQSKMVSFTIIGDPAIDQMVMPYSFSLRVSDALEGAAMVALAKKRGYHNIAVVFDSSASAQAFPPSLKFAASKAGLNIVAEPLVPQTAPSYEAVIDQVLQAHPDVVMMQIESNQAGTFFDEWRKLGGTSLPIISSDITVTPEWTKPAGADELGHITAVQATSNPSGPAEDRFTTTYKKLFNQDPAYLAQFAYDGVTLAALAMTAAHSTDPTTYRPYVLDVTKVAPDHQACYEYATCVALLQSGKKIKFVGLGSPFIFNQYHRTSGDFGAYSLSATSPAQLVEQIPASSLAGLY